MKDLQTFTTTRRFEETGVSPAMLYRVLGKSPVSMALRVLGVTGVLCACALTICPPQKLVVLYQGKAQRVLNSTWVYPVAPLYE